MPGAQFPRGHQRRWAQEIVRLVRDTPELATAEEPEPHVEAAIRYALGPDNYGCEYEVVIRSAKALREKWGKLVNRAQGQKRKPNGSAASRLSDTIRRARERHGLPAEGPR